MIFEIVNPSDPYTLECDDFKIAAAGILLLGRGKLGLTCEADPKLEMPPFIFANEQQVTDWFKGIGIDHIGEFIDQNRLKVADMLDTVLIGSERNRRTFEKVLACISDPAERQKARDTYHDEKRSSLNDIGQAAWDLATALRKPKKTDEPQATAQ
jgi:hypothetical protein